MLPATAESTNSGDQIWCPLPRRLGGVCIRWPRELLQVGTDCLSCRCMLGAVGLVPLGISSKKTIACAAEPLPNRFRPTFLDWADRLPLGLQPSDLSRCILPVC